MNPYIFNFLNGVLFVLLGLWTLALNWNYASYFIILGVILIVLTYAIRDTNKILGSIAMFSTMLSTIALGIIFYSVAADTNMYAAPIGMMLTSGFITSLAFVQCAMSHKDEAESCVPSIDGAACCDNTLSAEINSKAAGCC